ncbi:DUF1501 domain-containing protein [Nocardioides sp.]|uniref:DUF1501 domain-containing protein n=1 Tax=Nocardioides sp. TaxID=35761 RepID=UPI003D11AA6F
MTDKTPCGCPEFSTSRRSFLAAAAAGGVGMAGASLFGEAFRQVTYGGTPGEGGNVLVVMSLRGGSDGLSMVVPRGADHALLSGYREGIVVPEASLLGSTTDNRFGLHPAFAPLMPMWNAGTFGAVHAVGLPQPNRSHFDAMEVIEDADPGSSARVGWINRMVGLDKDATTQTSFNLGSSLLPTSQVGPAPALGAYRLSDLEVADLGNNAKRRKAALRKMWYSDKSGLGNSVRSTLDVVDMFGDLAAGAALDENDPANPVHTAAYPPGQLQSVLANTAALIKADLGTEVITVDYGNWDMHNGLGGNDPSTGWMHDQLDHFARSMVAFFDDLGTAASRVTVITISEFGRRVKENGDHGVDHGYGNAMLLLGAGVNGGDVHGGWKGLAQADLNDDDVPLAQDYRSVLWPVLKSRFGVSNKARVFPGFAEADVPNLMV